MRGVNIWGRHSDLWRCKGDSIFLNKLNSNLLGIFPGYTYTRNLIPRAAVCINIYHNILLSIPCSSTRSILIFCSFKNRNEKRKLVPRKRRDFRMKGTNKHMETYLILPTITDVFFNQKRINVCEQN